MQVYFQVFVQAWYARLYYHTKTYTVRARLLASHVLEPLSNSGRTFFCNLLSKKSKNSNSSRTTTSKKLIVAAACSRVRTVFHIENLTFVEDCRDQTVLWIDLIFWILRGNCYIINIL